MQIFLRSQFWPSSKNRFQITCLVQARTWDGLSSLVITHHKHAWEKVSFRRERSAESCFGRRYQSFFTAHCPQGKEIRLWKNPERCCHMSPWNSRGQNDWYLTPLAGEQAEKAAVKASLPHPTGIWTNLCASQGHTWKLWKGPEIASSWKGPLDGQDIPSCLLRQLSNETIFNTWKWSKFLSRGGRKYSR